MDTEMDEEAMFLIMDLSHQNNCITHSVIHDLHINVSDLGKIWDFHSVDVKDSGHMGSRVIELF
jgi:hypothetical protein